MEPNGNLVECLCGWLTTLCAGDEGRLVMARWEAAGVSLNGLDTDGVDSPLELARACHRDDGRGTARRVVAELLILARDDPVAGLCVLAALGPGLTRLLRLAQQWGLEPAEAESAVLVAAWEAVVGGASSAAEVMGRVRAEVCNAVRRERRRSARERSMPTTPEVELPEFTEGGGLLLVGEAVNAGVLSQRQASVLWAVRVHALSLGDVAESLGCSPGAVRKSVERSARLLRAYLDAECPEDGGR